MGGKKPWEGWAPGLVLALAALMAYWPALGAGFIWDDDAHLTGNPVVTGPSGFAEIWTTRAARICPLVFSVFRVEHALWGLNPLPYHLVNVLLHAGSGLVLWRLLLALGVRGAWLGAALWTLHPVQVESVAWITELKNTLSGFFYLLCVFSYVAWLKREDGVPGPGRKAAGLYCLALAGGALAMSAKSSTVILPLVLVLCAWWVERRWQWRRLAGVAPIFAMSVLASAWSMWSQKLEGAGEPEWARGWAERVTVAGKVVWFYLGKLLWPHPLMFVYPKWKLDPGTAAAWLPVLIFVAVLGLLWRWRGGALRPVSFAFAYFVVALLPVLGLVQHYFLRYSFVGDHFQYLASMGPLALVAAGLAAAGDCVSRERLWPKVALGGVLLATLAVLTWSQSWVYRSMETLWTDAIKKNPDCWMAWNNLGLDYVGEGRLDDAVRCVQKALELRPDAEFWRNLGKAEVLRRNSDKAIAAFEKAVSLRPHDAGVQTDLGVALLYAGRFEDAALQLRQATEGDPDYAPSFNNLGLALVQGGHAGEAAAEYRRALELAPDYADARNNLAAVLLQTGHESEAIAQWEEALKASPDYADAHLNLGSALRRAGRSGEAVSHFQRAVELVPNKPAAHYNLGSALLEKGRTEEAIVQFEKAVELQPAYADAHNDLGTALRQAGQAEKARSHYERAIEIQPRHAAAHYNLANTLLLGGQPAEAVAHYEKSLEIEPQSVAALNNLAWVLATCPDPLLRNGNRAADLSKRAGDLSAGINPLILRTQAAAAAEQGFFSVAVETASQAVRAASSEGNGPLAELLRADLDLYRSNQPYRDAPPPPEGSQR